jgi:hypothetical protein
VVMRARQTRGGQDEAWQVHRMGAVFGCGPEAERPGASLTVTYENQTRSQLREVIVFFSSVYAGRLCPVLCASHKSFLSIQAGTVLDLFFLMKKIQCLLFPSSGHIALPSP